MPLYEYSCGSCNTRFELRQGFDAAVVQPCPNCNNESTRVLHAPQIVYKADGFYSTDKMRNGFGSYWYDRADSEDKGIPQEDNVADFGDNPTGISD
jgi:putative FmdB family regulatory protein